MFHTWLTLYFYWAALLQVAHLCTRHLVTQIPTQPLQLFVPKLKERIVYVFIIGTNMFLN